MVDQRFQRKVFTTLFGFLSLPCPTIALAVHGTVYMVIQILGVKILHISTKCKTVSEVTIQPDR